MGKTNPIITLASLAQLTVRAFGIISGALVMIILSRGLSVTDFGHFTTVLSLLGLVAAGTELGLANTFVWKYHSSERGSLLAAFLAWRTLLGALGFVSGLSICALFMGPSLPIDSSALILSTLLLSGISSLQTLFVARKQVGIQNLLLFSQSAVWLIFVLVLFSLGSGLTGFSIGFFIAATLQAVITIAASRWKFEISKQNFRVHLFSLMKLTSFLGLTSLFVAIYYRIPSLVVYATLGPNESAMFNISQRLLDVVQVIPAAVLVTYLPNISGYFATGDKKSVNQEWKRQLRVLLPISIFVSAFVSTSASTLISVLFGEQYLNAVLVTQLLIWNFPLVVLGWLLSPILIASGRSKRLATVAALAVIVNIPTTLILTSTFGLIGACIAALVTEICVVVGLLASVFKMEEFDFELTVLFNGFLAVVGPILINLCTRFSDIEFIDLSIKLILASGLWGLCGVFLGLWKVLPEERSKNCRCRFVPEPIPHFKEKDNCKAYVDSVPHIRLDNSNGLKLKVFTEFLEHYSRGHGHLVVVSYRNGILAHQGSSYIGLNPIASLKRLMHYLNVVIEKSNEIKSPKGTKTEIMPQGPHLISKLIFGAPAHLAMSAAKVLGLTIGNYIKQQRRRDFHPWKIRVLETTQESIEGAEESFIVSDDSTLADPFYFEMKGRQLVAAEKLDKQSGLGRIVVFEKLHGSWTEIGTALAGIHHISFPFVFEYEGNLFMCPEESALEKIRVFRIGENPSELTEVSTLLQMRAVDCVIFFKDGLWWLLCTTKSQTTQGFHNFLNAYYADNPLSSNWIPHSKNPIIFDSRKARNGGLFHRDGSIYRVAQEQGFGQYGKSFGVYEIVKITPEDYVERATQDFDYLKESWSYTHHLHFSNNVFVQDFRE